MSTRVLLSARILFSITFIAAGLHKVFGWEATAGWMAMKGLPFVPILLVGAILLEVGAGIALLVGVRIREVAFTLAVFLIPTNFLFHNFWALSGFEQSSAMLHFLQNLSVIGGLLALAVAASPERVRHPATVRTAVAR